METDGRRNNAFPKRRPAQGFRGYKGIRYALTLDLETWEVIQRRAEQENVTVAVMLRHLIGWGLDQS
jgi:hypothetical protein